MIDKNEGWIRMIELWKECEGAKNIVISGHVRPDGDCVGACMSMYHFLRKVKPEAKINVYLEKPSDKFNCIKDVDKIKNEYDNIFEKIEYALLNKNVILPTEKELNSNPRSKSAKLRAIKKL